MFAYSVIPYLEVLVNPESKERSLYRRYKAEADAKEAQRQAIRDRMRAGYVEPQHVEHYPGPFSVGPRKIRGVLCEDGKQRTATCSDRGADTFFSIPARVRARGKTVSGYVTRETLAGYDAETPDDPAVWKFIAYRYGKNAGAILEH
jgi:hypothetical protein